MTDDTPPAFPVKVPGPLGGTRFLGLTIREYFAAHAAAAVVSNPSYDDQQPAEVARHAVNIADALVNELTKGQKDINK